MGHAAHKHDTRGASQGVHVVHLSVLNPVRHPRILYRQAVSQAEAGFSVAVIANGSPDEAPIIDQDVQLYPIDLPGRLHWRRLLRPWRLVWLALRMRARVVHLHSPELLLPALWLRLRGAMLVYDVHEDYAANIRHTQAWPAWLRLSLAWGVRLIERLAVRGWLHHVTYAEASYRNHLNAIESQYSYLLNRYAPPALPIIAPTATPVVEEMPVMLYSGTLADAWGFSDTLALWDGLNKHQPVRLVLAASGDEALFHSPQVQQLLARWPDRWQRAGNGGFVAHDEIVGWMHRATFATALYQPLPHLAEKQPSKFFECMAHGLPLIYRATPAWDAWNTRLGFGVGIQQIDDAAIQLVLAQLASNFPAINRAIEPSEWAWDAVDAPIIKQLTTRWLHASSSF